MAFFRSERGIGRGEIPESRLELPFFAFIMVLCSLILFVLHLRLENQSLTLALAISLFVFGATVVRVEFGVYVLVLSMLLSPEIVTDASGETSLKIRYDDLLIIVIFMGVMVKLAFEGRLHLWRPSPINAGIVVYYGICILSTLLALERNLGAWNRRDAFFVMLKMLEFYLVFFLVSHAVRDKAQIRNQLVLFFVVSLAVSVYGILTIPITDRVSAPFDEGGTEPNTLGGYLTLVMCVALGLFTQTPKTHLKILFGAIVAVAFIPFLYTLSRASYMALIIGVVVLCICSRRYLMLAVIALILAASSLVMPEKVQERVLYTFQQGGGEEVVVAGRDTGIQVDKSTNERILIWRKVRFILGLGPQFFLLGAGVSWESVLDSQYARIILETGLLGILAFGFMQYRILKTVREGYRWTDDWLCRGLGMGVFAASMALIVHGLGTISFLIVRIMEPYWFLLALMVVVRENAMEKHWVRFQKEHHGRPQESASPLPSLTETA